MLKIFRIRPCENNKSCSIFFHESNKIGLAIFWSFYDFLHVLQNPAKLQHYSRWNLSPRPLQKIREVQLIPSAVGGGGAGRIPASRPRSRPGKRWGVTVGSPRVDGWSELGWGGCRRGGSTAAGGGCRGGASSGEYGWQRAQITRLPAGKNPVGWGYGFVFVPTSTGAGLTLCSRVKLQWV
jgi:hypothetical protein